MKQNPQVRAEAVATAADIRRVLDTNPHKAALLKKEQEKALEVFRSRAILTPEERRMGRSAELVAHHIKTQNNNALAEAFALGGHYEAALRVVERDDLRAEFQEKFDAIQKPDINCACPDFRDELGLRMPNQHIEAQVMVGGKIKPAIRCTVCGDLNVRDAPIHLIEQREVRRSGKEVKAAEFFKR